MARKHYVCSLESLNSVAVEKKPTRSLPLITFIDEDFEGIDRCHNDPMVVKIQVVNILVCKVLLDNGRSIDVLYWLAFKQLGLPKSQIEPFSKKFIGFAGETMDTIRYMHLLTTFED